MRAGLRTGIRMQSGRRKLWSKAVSKKDKRRKSRFPKIEFVPKVIVRRKEQSETVSIKT